MSSGYWQLEVAPDDKHKTAFITRYGLFQHVRMGFGLCNVPATFQRAMQKVLEGLLWDIALVYLDDDIVVGFLISSWCKARKAKFECRDQYQKAFESLREAMTSAPIIKASR